MGFVMPQVRVGRGPEQLTVHGAVHDNPDDKLVLFEYESFTRNMAVNNVILLCVGRVRSKSEGGTAGGAISTAATPKQKSEATGSTTQRIQSRALALLYFFGEQAL